jgi:PAS domain S-box-containing protein
MKNYIYIILLFACLPLSSKEVSEPGLVGINASGLDFCLILGISVTVIVISVLILIHIKARKSFKKLLAQVELTTVSTIGSKMVMWELTVDSNLMKLSDSFFVLTGYEKDLFEHSFQSFKHRVHSEDLDVFNKLFHKTDSNNETNQVRFRLKKQDGEYIWLNAIARLNQDAISRKKGKLTFDGILLDITKEVENEKKSIDEGKILDKLMELADIQAWTWNVKDKKFKFILNNNIKNSNIQTVEDFLDFIFPKDAQKVSVAISDYINQKTADCYVQFRDRTGKIWYEFVAYTQKYDTETNKPFQFVGFQREITERKRLNEFYRESQKVETISRLVGGMAHDFNNILQIIHGFTELAMSDMAYDSDQYQNLQLAMQGTEKAESLVEQLLTFSKDDRNRPFPLIVADGLNNFTNSVNNKLKVQNIDFVVENTIGDARVYVDPKKLDQILSKLVDNSVDAVVGLDNPKIKIETNYQIVEKDKTRFGLNIKPGKYVVISVKDNGYGIKSKTKQLLFEPFFTTKDVGEGRGLGLSTVYNCVKAHEGFIKVVSRPDIDGTCFDIYFPVYELINKKARKFDAAKALKNNNNSPTILVVDDFQISIDIVKKYLNKKYVVFESTTAAEALDLFSELHESIDVVILDCIMDNANGLELYNQMLLIKPDLPVIYMSGYTQNDVERQFGEKISDIFLLKPLQKEVLLTALNNLTNYDYKE